jgi:dynein assembly factor 1
LNFETRQGTRRIAAQRLNNYYQLPAFAVGDMVEIEASSSTSTAMPQGSASKTKDALDAAIERLQNSDDHRESDLDIITTALVPEEIIIPDNDAEQEQTRREYGIRMTKQALKEVCRSHPQVLYETPYLNERMFLHHKGFVAIENLEEFTEVRTLYLESNGLKKIEGLDSMVHMRKLYLQENLIATIENLDALSNLTFLDLSNNSLRKIENLDCLAKLQELQLSRNDFQTAEDIQHLRQCPSIQELDLENNNLAEPDVLDVLADMPILSSLRLKGNKMVRKVRHYRKHVLSIMPGLKHFDESPVFESERARVEAWGGALAEAPGDFKAAQLAEKSVLKSRAADKREKSSEQHNWMGALKPGWTPSAPKTGTNALGDSSAGGSCFDSSFQQASTQEKKPFKMSDLLGGAGDPRSTANAVADCENACKDLYKQDPIWYNFYLQEPIDRASYEDADAPDGGIGPARPYVSPIGEMRSGESSEKNPGKNEKGVRSMRRIGVDPPTSLPGRGEGGVRVVGHASGGVGRGGESAGAVAGGAGIRETPHTVQLANDAMSNLSRDCFDGTFMSRMDESRKAVERERVPVARTNAGAATADSRSAGAAGGTDMDELD